VAIEPIGAGKLKAGREPGSVFAAAGRKRITAELQQSTVFRNKAKEVQAPTLPNPKRGRATRSVALRQVVLRNNNSSPKKERRKQVSAMLLCQSFQ
jgi:hypothetical protein